MSVGPNDSPEGIEVVLDRLRVGPSHGPEGTEGFSIAQILFDGPRTIP